VTARSGSTVPPIATREWTRSLAPEVELISVRVLGASLKGSAGVFATGVEWCIDNGIDVANLSLSTTNERWAETFHELLDAATFRRMLVVSAMANERKRTIPSEFHMALAGRSCRG